MLGLWVRKERNGRKLVMQTIGIISQIVFINRFNYSRRRYKEKWKSVFNLNSVDGKWKSVKMIIT